MPESILDGRWVLNSVIGEGNYGIVWKAQDKLTKRPVVVKSQKYGTDIPPIMISEIAVLTVAVFAKCANIVTYLAHGYDKHTGLPYMVLERLGPSVQEIALKTFEEKGHFNEENIKWFGCQILEGIRQTHSLSYVHRDVKPANCAVTLDYPKPGFLVKLLDFGRAKPFKDYSGFIPALEKPRFHGPVVYASVTGHRHQQLGRVDDLISLYYTLVHFYLGQLPWLGLTDVDTIGHFKELFTPILPVHVPAYLAEFYRLISQTTNHSEPDYSALHQALIK